MAGGGKRLLVGPAQPLSRRSAAVSATTQLQLVSGEAALSLSDVRSVRLLPSPPLLVDSLWSRSAERRSGRLQRLRLIRSAC